MFRPLFFLLFTLLIANVPQNTEVLQRLSLRSNGQCNLLGCKVECDKVTKEGRRTTCRTLAAKIGSRGINGVSGLFVVTRLKEKKRTNNLVASRYSMMAND